MELEENRVEIPFTRYYNELANTNPEVDFREKVVKECQISYKTFYNWVNNPEQIRPVYREKIATIAGKPVHELFGN